MEIQLTEAPHNHILTNHAIWSREGWIVYDVRSDLAGNQFDGRRIERVHVASRKVEVLYESPPGACCGVVTCSPTEDRIVFIHGPENPTPNWSYSAFHRRGVLLDIAQKGSIRNLDACDLVPPFTPGALRGGSHVHTFDSFGAWVAFTYEDHVLAQLDPHEPDHDLNQRNVGVSVPIREVKVPRTHPRNHDGAFFSVLVTQTVNHPRPGSDEIARAFEEGWIGNRGYLRADGSRQVRAVAFQGQVVTENGEAISEVFIVDLPEDPTIPGDEPLEGTEKRRPAPPKGTQQRRLTYTSKRKHPGIQGPRHWLRFSPEGNQIAFLMKDEEGIVQLWSISPNGREPRQITRNPWPIASAFSWSPDGKQIAHVMDGSVFITDVESGLSQRLTPRREEAEAPRPEACVFSPDGSMIAYVRNVARGEGKFNQIFVVEASVAALTLDARLL